MYSALAGACTNSIGGCRGKGKEGSEIMEEKIMIMREIADQVKKLKEEDLRTLKGVAVGLQLAREHGQEEKKVG